MLESGAWSQQCPLLGRSRPLRADNLGADDKSRLVPVPVTGSGRSLWPKLIHVGQLQRPCKSLIKNAPAGFGGLPGHLWHRMLVVGFDRRGGVTKLRLTIRQCSGADQFPQRIATSEEGVPAMFGGLVSPDLINAFATNRTKPNMNPPTTVP